MRPLGRPSYRWENIIKINGKETEYEDVGYTYVAQNSDM
jgi:hypothetical protein